MRGVIFDLGDAMTAVDRVGGHVDVAVVAARFVGAARLRVPLDGRSRRNPSMSSTAPTSQ